MSKKHVKPDGHTNETAFVIDDNTPPGTPTAVGETQESNVSDTQQSQTQVNVTQVYDGGAAGRAAGRAVSKLNQFNGFRSQAQQDAYASKYPDGDTPMMPAIKYEPIKYN